MEFSTAATARQSTTKGPKVNTKMKITLKHETPIQAPPQLIFGVELERLKLSVKKLLEKGHIRPSTSAYASPVMMVEKKKRGEFRLLVSYAGLNNATIRESFPPRDIDEFRARLSCKTFYSRYRIKRDFHLVKMAEDSIKYTSFVTTFGQFEFLVMPFGLVNSPCFFMRFLYEIFAPMIKDQSIILHMEDILIATKEEDEHLSILRRMNEVIAKHHLSVKVNKSYTMEKEMHFMGFIINKRGAQYTMKFASDDDGDDDDNIF